MQELPTYLELTCATETVEGIESPVGCCASAPRLCVRCRQRFESLAALQPRLTRRLRSWGADHHCAEELASEALVVVWRRLDRVPVEPGAAEAWLAGVSRNLLANHNRVAGRRRRRAERFAADARRRQTLRVREEADGAAFVSVIALAEAWTRLSRADREVLGLAAGAGGSTPALLGRTLGCGPGAAATRLSRARARLRSQLAGQA